MEGQGHADENLGPRLAPLVGPRLAPLGARWKGLAYHTAGPCWLLLEAPRRSGLLLLSRPWARSQALRGRGPACLCHPLPGQRRWGAVGAESCPLCTQGLEHAQDRAGVPLCTCVSGEA